MRTQIDEPVGWQYEFGLLNQHSPSPGLSVVSNQKASAPYVLTEKQKLDGSGKTLDISLPVTALSAGDLVLVGFPDSQVASAPQLLVLHETYSNDWIGPSGASHVLVDGTINGWLVRTPLDAQSAHYAPTILVSAGLWTSAAGVLVLLAVAFSLLPLKRLWIRFRDQLHG